MTKAYFTPSTFLECEKCGWHMIMDSNRETIFCVHTECENEGVLFKRPSIELEKVNEKLAS